MFATYKKNLNPDRRKLLGRFAIKAVVGDNVRVVGDSSGDDGSLARIVEVRERTTELGGSFAIGPAERIMPPPDGQREGFRTMSLRRAQTSTSLPIVTVRSPGRPK